MSIPSSTDIQALLDSLRSSPVWQQQAAVLQGAPIASVSSDADMPEAETAENMPDEEVSEAIGSSSAGSQSKTTSTESTSIEALLAQLGPPKPKYPPLPVIEPISGPSSTVYQPSGLGYSPLKASPPPPPPDVKHLSFQQSLPVIATLSSDDFFVASITRLKWEQDALEQKLWGERSAIHTKYDEKSKAAQKKAAIMAAPWSKHEANMMNDAYRIELRQFDAKRVLPAWDGLIAKQQATLERLAVPTMFVTSTPGDLNRQQRVMQILEGIAGGDAHS